MSTSAITLCANRRKIYVMPCRHGWPPLEHSPSLPNPIEIGPGNITLISMKRLVIMCGLYLPALLLHVAAARAAQEAAPAAAEPVAAEPAAMEPTAAEPPAEQQTKVTPEDNPELARTIDRYRNDIRQLQIQHGAYAPGLSETLLGLGDAYSQTGAHEEAAQTFKSALYIERVNTGLYSMTQLPYLDRLIQEYTSMGNLKDAGNMYSYMYWVYKRNYGDNDLRNLPPITQMQDWIYKAYGRGDTAIPLEQLRKLNFLNYKAIGIMQVNYGKTDPRLINYLRRYALANLYEAEQLRKVLEKRRVNTNLNACPFSLQDNKNNTYMDDVIAQMVYERCNNYMKGKKALQHILTIQKVNDMSVAAFVRALTHIGDWEMLFQRSLAALSYYSRAFNILAKAGHAMPVMDELFGQPRLLTTAGSLDLEAADKKDAGTNGGGPFAVVSLDVTSLGKARNIKVVQSDPPGDEQLQSEAQSYLRKSRFRPRMENGKSVNTVGYTVTYRQAE